MKRRRRHPQLAAPEDKVIDLRDRLAPYDDVVVLPPSPTPDHLQTARPDDSELFTPLEFDFEYRMGGRS
jgi:hypothetical protein